jgi:alkanesulfonate monooxygenase SsuD/methylene tetrahydromethanopterin reductase-like flavin-dependent oxidoreductase (luciferase family)
LEALIKPPGFSGRAPGGPSRWATERSGDWHPLAPTLVVEVQYDHLSGGRFRLGIGVGWNEVEFEALGMDAHTRGRRVEEQIEVLRALWTHEVVSFHGKWHTISDAGINPLPLQRPIPIWFGGGSGDAALRRVARLGDGWLVTPNIAPEGAAKMARYYLERCQAHGRKPTSIGLRRDLYVGESSAEAQAVKAAAVARGYRGFDPATLIAGTVDEVVTVLRPFAAMGYTDVLVRHLTTDQAKVLGSLERLADVRAALT